MSETVVEGIGAGAGRERARPAGGVLGLLAASAAVALLWLVILPLVARQPAVERHLRAMDDARVNPAAMYYTDLDRLPLLPAWADRHLVLWP